MNDDDIFLMWFGWWVTDALDQGKTIVCTPKPKKPCRHLRADFPYICAKCGEEVFPDDPDTRELLQDA